jgi:TPP-dependent pyruvate/acetoin dehydrogenase alpha subunit
MTEAARIQLTFEERWMARRSKTARAHASVGSHSNPPAGKELKLTVDQEVLRRLYANLLKCRMAAERLRRVAGSANSALPRFEAAHLAATIELTEGDAISAVRKELPLDVVRGASLASAMANGNGVTSATGVQVIPAEGAGSSQLNIAAGVAAGFHIRSNRNVVVALADASSLLLGSSYEALNYVARHRLPLIVVVDNGEQEHGAEAVQDLTWKAQAHGIFSIAVDGNDAVAVYRVAREASNRARAGRGPSLIECRFFEETRDPIPHLEQYLEKHRLWTPEWKRELALAYRREIDQVLASRN